MITKSSPKVSWATSKSPTGPFEWNKSIYPNRHWVGDLTVFVDPVSFTDAYLIYSVRPGAPDKHVRDIMVTKLTANWLDVESAVVSEITDAREGPAAFYADGVGYFIWTSHVTGWNPNAAAVYHSKSLAGPWTAIGNPTGSNTSFSSQSTYIQQVNATTFVYIADRFEPYIKNKVDPRYVWLPITGITETSLTVKWEDEWSL
jgi:hypothetical protein